MLRVSRLCAGYEGLLVLKDVSLELPTGKVGVLMGPNGAGKSTLLKAIFNLVQISSGRIEFDGENLLGLPTHMLLRRGVSYMPQGRINFSTLTVWENLLMGAAHRYSQQAVAGRVSKILAEFPALQEKKKEYAFRLSGGQQQMLALARAMITMPKVLLLDEPSLGLAPKLIKAVFAKIRHINQVFGTTVLVVEHNIKSVLTIADYGFIMVSGQVVAADRVEKLRQSKVLQQVFVGELE